MCHLNTGDFPLRSRRQSVIFPSDLMEMNKCRVFNRLRRSGVIISPLNLPHFILQYASENKKLQSTARDFALRVLINRTLWEEKTPLC